MFKDMVWTLEWAKHEEGCELSQYMVLNCFRCKAKGEVNV